VTEPIEDRVRVVPCPRCGELTLRFTTRLEARPLGTWSLAGRQDKTSAVEWPYVVCDADGCDFEKRAKLTSG
jgi:hypothetical protein